MEEGTIRRWLKSEGESVEIGEILLEIDTDKASVEVEAPHSGILLKILCVEGETIPVLQPIALLGEAGEDTSAYLRETDGGSLPLSPAASGIPESPASPESISELIEPSKLPERAGPAEADMEPMRGGLPRGTISAAGRVPVSPAARRVAREMGIDLAKVGPGTGPGGRILSTDVAGSGALQSRIGRPATRHPLSRMRRAIGRALQASKQTIPHFYMRLTIDADPLMEIYRVEKEKYSCTINDLIAAACAKVLREFPAFRSSLENEEIVEQEAVNIGIAVGMDEGLIVPVIAEVDRMTLPQLAAASRRIIETARRGKLEPTPGAVFTISNLGASGVEEFAAIINPPEAAILAVGAIREAVVVKAGFMRPGRILTFTLSSDHRIIDGLMAARFLGRLKEILEAPAVLLN